MRLELRTALAGLCGTSLTAVLAERHAPGERSPISLWLETADGGFQLRNAPHGYGLAALDERPVPYDMGEYGTVDVVDSPLIPLGEVEAAWLVFAPAETEEEPTGVGIQVAGAEPVLVYCVDDELYAEARTRDDVGPVRYEPVCGTPPSPA